ncbi:MAG: hypothetical protein JXQ73_33170 [Phycisphaerae bacterium]|nr:hypothetical protein [Phycisphaerae bacterium]
MKTKLTALVLITITGPMAAAEQQSPVPKTADLLNAGKETVRIVCFGDSITGAYYHTGGNRAWCDMLGIALQRIYPNAKLQMINAGISGHTTVNALARIQKDVLDKKPHLVVIMFGMNDVTRVKRGDYAENLKNIVTQCQRVGAEVILCTPNSIYPEDGNRPVDRLAAFAETVRDVAKEMKVPLCDCYASYEAVRAKDPTEWKLLMSETIHPNMNGHKLFAEDIAQVISGKRVSLADVRAVEPCIPHTAALLAGGKPIKLIAMPPYDQILPRVLAKLNPKSKVTVVSCPVAGKSLAEIEPWSKGIRDQKPDLVIVAVPPDALPDDVEKLIRSYSWVLNWSLSFGKPEWDCVAVLPSVTRSGLGPKHQPQENLMRRVIFGQDIGFIERTLGNDSPAEDIVLRWFKARYQPPK